MSTFNGVLEEFPDITSKSWRHVERRQVSEIVPLVDYFRKVQGRRPPLAAFLSHVHSDHLCGLDSFKAPFIYCSVATRELLLRLEKYPSRMNFTKGILETRQQDYRHLKNLLKPLPLNTPVSIELGPQQRLQVTLFDANHCIGSVMFLIENESNAILYSGDVRSEPWWVNRLTRDPVLLPYTTGLRRLDKIYLDTSFVTAHYRNHTFPSKLAGLQELLQKVSAYPSHVNFHLHAWTLGYEEVWIALAHAMQCQVHVDRYKLDLFSPLRRSAAAGLACAETAALVGCSVGNGRQAGCLTCDSSARIHSCEYKTSCPVLTDPKTVFITPIICRSNDGQTLAEPSVGQMTRDSDLGTEIELISGESAQQLKDLCYKVISDRQKCQRALARIDAALRSQEKTLYIPKLRAQNEVVLRDVVHALASTSDRPADTKHLNDAVRQNLPTRIVFPYSRHSSYQELCSFLDALKPADVHPCTFHDDDWSEEWSVEALFGQFCTAKIFSYDAERRAAKHFRRTNTVLGAGPLDVRWPQSQTTENSSHSEEEATQGWSQMTETAATEKREVALPLSREVGSSHKQADGLYPTKSRSGSDGDDNSTNLPRVPENIVDQVRYRFLEAAAREVSSKRPRRCMTLTKEPLERVSKCESRGLQSNRLLTAEIGMTKEHAKTMNAESEQEQALSIVKAQSDANMSRTSVIRDSEDSVSSEDIDSMFDTQTSVVSVSSRKVASGLSGPSDNQCDLENKSLSHGTEITDNHISVEQSEDEVIITGFVDAKGKLARRKAAYHAAKMAMVNGSFYEVLDDRQARYGGLSASSETDEIEL